MYFLLALFFGLSSVLASNTTYQYLASGVKESQEVVSLPKFRSDPVFERFYAELVSGREFSSNNEVGHEIFPTWMKLISNSPSFKSMRVENLIAASGSTNKCAVIADARTDAHLPVVIKHTMNMLGNKWSLHIFHTDGNAAFLLRELQISRLSKVQMIRMRSLTAQQYNALVLSAVFWDSLPASCEHVLVFKSDTIARKQASMDRFLDYDYIGAPWPECDDKSSACWFGGDGDCSLRHKPTLKSLLTVLNCSRWDCQETDIYSQHVHTDEFTRAEDRFLALQFARAHRHDVTLLAEHLRYRDSCVPLTAVTCASASGSASACRFEPPSATSSSTAAGQGGGTESFADSPDSCRLPAPKRATLFPLVLPHRATAAAFAVKGVFHPDPHFVVGAWRWLNPLHVVQLVASTLQYYD